MTNGYHTTHITQNVYWDIELGRLCFTYIRVTIRWSISTNANNTNVYNDKYHIDVKRLLYACALCCTHGNVH